MGYKTYTCPVQKNCGGCQWLNVPYPIQLRRKHEELNELLGSYCKIEPVIGMDEPLRYRNKSITPFAPGKSGRVLYGLYEQNSHRIVQVDDCLITSEKAAAIIKTVASLLKSFKIQPYDEDRQEGFLRHLLIRDSHYTGEIMVTFVCANTIFPSQKAFMNTLRKRHPEISTIVMNVNRRDTNVILGEQEKVLYGKGWIEDKLCGCLFRISSRSFYQTNPLQTEKLYSAAIDMAQLTGSENVIDTYCGIGTIGLIASKKAGHVLGIEQNADAVRDAKANARRNKAENIDFFVGDAAAFMGETSRKKDNVDVVFMDPPRAGSNEKFLSSLVHLAPKRVVYISCNPKTQARDMAYLVENGYRVTKIQPVDMFPHTAHVETVALLSKVGK